MGWNPSNLTDKQRRMIAGAEDRERWYTDTRIKLTMSEAAFQAVVVELAELRGWPWIFHDNDARKNRAGFPDLELSCPRRGFFKAELKKETEKPREDQANVIDILRASGVTVYVWKPSDWREIVDTLW